jgi:hypothetical protein
MVDIAGFAMGHHHGFAGQLVPEAEAVHSTSVPPRPLSSPLDLALDPLDWQWSLTRRSKHRVFTPR